MKYWVGEQLRMLRLRKKITQEALGAVAGLSQAQMSRIEQCLVDPGVHQLLVMLQFMDVRITDVVNGYGPARLNL